MEARKAAVPDTCDGERLDKVLGILFDQHSRSQLARLVANGCVRVNTHAETKASHRVASGDAIEIDFPPPVEASAAGQDLPLTVIFEDADLAVIDKPAGLVVHPAAGHPDETLVNALIFHVKDLSGVGGELRPGIVHRLDKDTSGVMVIAKNDRAHRALTQAWSSENVRKEYLAVVYGAVEPERGTIDAPIGRDPRNRKRMAVVAGARRAVTQYETAARLRHASVIRCFLLTGRTHQIRVHLKHLGHPIIGDEVYSGPQWHGVPDRKVQKAMASMPRQALHAARISFPHPSTGEQLRFEAPLPADMRALIEALR